MEKIEIELKFPLNETKELIERLNRISRKICEERQIDSYYTPFHRDFIKQKPIIEWLRIREYHKDGKVLFNFNYKNFGSNKKEDAISCGESETEIGDFQALRGILKSLDFREIIVVDKKRINFSYKDCIISIDSVVDLGDFIEIEIEGEFGSLDESKKHLHRVLDEIGAEVGEQLFIGYPQILLKKNGIFERERVAIFIDGSNLYHGLKILGNKITDFNKFIKLLANGKEIKGIFYYTARMDRTFDEKRFQKHQNFLHKLHLIPRFKVIFCMFKKIIEKDGKVKYEIKGDDVQLANDMVVGAFENLYDTAILVSGDEDFKPVVRTVKRLGKKVENVFFRGGSSSRLRKICNNSKNIRFILEKL